MKRILTLTGAAVLSLGSPEIIGGAVVVAGASAGVYGLYRLGKKAFSRRETIEIQVPAGDPVVVTVPSGSVVDPDSIPTETKGGKK